VHFVDVVVDPSAGGEILGLAEADDGGISDMKGLEKLLKLIEAKAPDRLKELDMANLDPDKVVEIVEAIMAEAQKQPKKEADAPDVSTIVTEAMAPFKGVLEQIASERLDALFSRVFAESKLPASAKGIVRKTLGATFTEVQVTEAIKSHREYLSSLRGDFRGPGSAFELAENIVDEHDKLQAALDGFFIGEAVALPGDEKRKIPAATSIREWYIQKTGDVGFTGRMDKAYRIAEAGVLDTTALADSLANSLNRALQKEYNEAPYDQWRQVANITTARDFRAQARPILGGFAGMASVAQGTDYAALSTPPTDINVPLTIGKTGGTQDITLEAIANDDVGVIRRIPQKIGRAAARALSVAAWAPIIGNSAWGGGGGALFLATTARGSTSAGNLTTSAMSWATLNTGRVLMAKQREMDSAATLGIQARWLIVPIDLEEAAIELCYATGKPMLSNAAAGTATDAFTQPNFLRKVGVDVLVIPHLSDVSDWFMAADRKDIDLLEVCFFGGREEPELFVQDMPNVGSMFTADKLTYKIRHIYGVAALDFRGWYGGYGVS
jgi:hypothetical protein